MKDKRILTSSLAALCAALTALFSWAAGSGRSNPCAAAGCREPAAVTRSQTAAENPSPLKYTVEEGVPASPAVEKLLDIAVVIPPVSQSVQDPGVAGIPDPARASTGLTGDGSFIDAAGHFFRIYDQGINNFVMYTIDAGDGIKEFVAEYDNDAGEHQISYSGVYYDEAKNSIYGRDERGVFAIGFDYDVGQHTIYAAKNSWQRDYGFCALYDMLSPLAGFDYRTVRIKFPYDGKDWLIQLWKGRYIITMGGEIGIYNKPQDRAEEFYDCAGDDYLMPISMRLLTGDEVLFTKDPQNSWWQTGFKLGRLVPPWMLTLEGTIVFPNEAMRDAFTAAIDAKAANPVRYTVDGNAVSLVW